LPLRERRSIREVVEELIERAERIHAAESGDAAETPSTELRKPFELETRCERRSECAALCGVKV